MRVGECNQLVYAVRLSDRVGIRDDDVFGARRPDALVHVRREAQRAVVLGHADSLGDRLRAAAGPVRDDDHLVDLGQQGGQRRRQQVRLARSGRDEDPGDLHAARTSR
jgi:hypothetical protein